MRTVPLRFYSLHIRTEQGLIDYQEFLEEVRSFKSIEVEVALDYTVVLNKAEFVDAETFEIVFLGGDRDANTVYFDRDEGDVVVEGNTNQRWTAKPTRAVISLRGEERIVALESSRGGVTPLLLERYLERIEIQQISERTVDITPLPAKSFIDEIDSFERIRVASVEVSRPNIDWSDQANQLYELADASDAQSSTAEVKAARGQSLSKTKGLVEVIRTIARSVGPSVKNAKIEGRKPGDSRDRMISLEKHQERSFVGLDQSLPLSQQNDSLLRSFREHIQRIRDKRDDSEE